MKDIFKKLSKQLGITTLAYFLLSIGLMFAMKAGFMCTHVICFVHEPIGLGIFIVSAGILSIPYGVALVIVLFILTPINIIQLIKK